VRRVEARTRRDALPRPARACRHARLAGVAADEEKQLPAEHVATERVGPARLVPRVHVDVRDVGHEDDGIALRELVPHAGDEDLETPGGDDEVLARSSRVWVGVFATVRAEVELVELGEPLRVGDVGLAARYVADGRRSEPDVGHELCRLGVLPRMQGQGGVDHGLEPRGVRHPGDG
jgi:hypothetical protein